MGACAPLCHNLKMKVQKEIPTYKRYRYPIEIIRHCVWLYFRFSLSYRDVELLMTERGIIVSYESIRQWCLKFGEEYAQKLRSYGAALREVLPHVDHRQHKGLNNRVENSHRPTRRREKVMQKFNSMDHAQQFLSPFGLIYEHFKPKRHLMSAADYRQLMSVRLQD